MNQPNDDANRNLGSCLLFIVLGLVFLGLCNVQSSGALLILPIPFLLVGLLYYYRQNIRVYDRTALYDRFIRGTGNAPRVVVAKVRSTVSSTVTKAKATVRRVTHRP